MLRVIQQRQDAAVHRPADIQIPVLECGQWHQCAEFVIAPVLNDLNSTFTCGIQIGGSRPLIIKLIGPGPARPDFCSTVDHKRLGQPTLDLGLHPAQGLPHFGIRHEKRGLPFGIQEPGQPQCIACQLLFMFCLIGLRCL